jgi:hypothetical protein
MTDLPVEASVAAQVMTHLTPAELAPALRRAGLDAHLGQSTYKGAWVTLAGAGDLDCSLQPNDSGEYLLRDGCGERRALEELARALSAALSRMGIRHRMELYDENHHMFDYLHHDWPLD